MFLPDSILQKSSLNKRFDFSEGVLILIDKPLEWTSFDVVNKIRFKLKHTLKLKKIKVGHAGTLDPLASGLLLICTGKYTKSIDTLQAMEKAYSGTIQIGATTPTYDAESDPENFTSCEHLTLEDILTTKQPFIGKIDQKPPIFSAIKVKGQKSCDLARRGVELDLKTRPIEISRFDTEWDGKNQIKFMVECTKGTYIRSLAHDLGQTLGVGGFLSSLKREKIGQYSVENAISVEECVEHISLYL